jgi:hypothetical protein
MSLKKTGEFMKLLTIIIALSTSTALACPGAGTISLTFKGQPVAIISEYDATLSVTEGYDLGFLTTKPSNISGGGVLNHSINWQWICNDYASTDSYGVKIPTTCRDLTKSSTGAYSLPEGERDFTVFIRRTGDTEFATAIGFRVTNANIDPKQPRARGGCGREIQADQ